MSYRQQLLEAAAQLSLPAGEADGWLGSREALQAVAEDDREAKDRQEAHARSASAKDPCLSRQLSCARREAGRSGPCCTRPAHDRLSPVAPWAWRPHMACTRLPLASHRCLPSRPPHSRGIRSVPTFLISCGAGKPVQLVGAESVKAFEVAFRKTLHEAGISTKSGGALAGKAAEQPREVAAEE